LFENKTKTNAATTQRSAVESRGGGAKIIKRTLSKIRAFANKFPWQTFAPGPR
jgi:hypothetical protein